jgi:hypothetical protein
MKRISLALLMLALGTLACSSTLTKPPANLSAGVSTETPIPSRIPIPTVPTETPAPITCRVTAAESLHLRDSPNIKGTVITWLSPGDQLILLPDPPIGAWVKVTTADNLTGWVNSTYCEVTQ